MGNIGPCEIADVLDGATATMPNAKLSQATCDSQEIESLETKQPA